MGKGISVHGPARLAWIKRRFQFTIISSMVVEIPDDRPLLQTAPSAGTVHELIAYVRARSGSVR